ncbi:MAG: hypothetical protein RJS97_08495, partial [Parvibaculaceae bacterium]
MKITTPSIWNEASFIQSLPELLEFDLHCPKGNNIENLENLPVLNLKKLRLSRCNKVTDFSPLVLCRHLMTLNLWACNIPDFDWCKHLKKVEDIQLMSVDANDFTGLRALTGLKHINLSGS